MRVQMEHNRAAPRHVMSSRALKTGYYALTAANTVATQYYLNYLFFYLRDRFGFDNRANLWIAALHGGVYVFAAWQGGKFAERRGYTFALQLGFAGLFLSMLAGAWVSTVGGTIAVVTFFTIVLLFTWPALEALTSADVPPGQVPHMVGIYNLTWSAGAALAYFTGGPLYDRLGAGLIFAIPAVFFLVQLAALRWMVSRAQTVPTRSDAAEPVAAPATLPIELRGQPGRAATFLNLAWMANPLAYVAIYTLLAVMPGIAAALGLTPTEVGLYCSIWFFARTAMFGLLWRWTGWHYRFRWLAAAYVLLVASFGAILIAPSLLVLIAGQLVFGAATGMVYYSSLFYSMDLSDKKAEHGGIHEAAIGLGIFVGPAVGALSIQFFPGQAHAGAAAVTALLAAGLAAMLLVWRRGTGRRPSRSKAG